MTKKKHHKHDIRIVFVIAVFALALAIFAFSVQKESEQKEMFAPKSSSDISVKDHNIFFILKDGQVVDRTPYRIITDGNKEELQKYDSVQGWVTADYSKLRDTLPESYSNFDSKTVKVITPNDIPTARDQNGNTNTLEKVRVFAPYNSEIYKDTENNRYLVKEGNSYESYNSQANNWQGTMVVENRLTPVQPKGQQDFSSEFNTINVAYDNMPVRVVNKNKVETWDRTKNQWVENKGLVYENNAVKDVSTGKTLTNNIDSSDYIPYRVTNVDVVELYSATGQWVEDPRLKYDGTKIIGGNGRSLETKSVTQTDFLKIKDVNVLYADHIGDLFQGAQHVAAKINAPTGTSFTLEDDLYLAYLDKDPITLKKGTLISLEEDGVYAEEDIGWFEDIPDVWPHSKFTLLFDYDESGLPTGNVKQSDAAQVTQRLNTVARDNAAQQQTTAKTGLESVPADRLSWVQKTISDLKLTKNEDGSYSQEGDFGKYLVQSDGSIFYEGSGDYIDRSGINEITPQTLPYGANPNTGWDTSRSTSLEKRMQNLGSVPQDKRQTVINTIDQLYLTQNDDGSYSQDGYTGKYWVQSDGSIFYEGGEDRSSWLKSWWPTELPPQTLPYGADPNAGWDATRTTRLQTAPQTDTKIPAQTTPTNIQYASGPNDVTSIQLSNPDAKGNMPKNIELTKVGDDWSSSVGGDQLLSDQKVSDDLKTALENGYRITYNYDNNYKVERSPSGEWVFYKENPVTGEKNILSSSSNPESLVTQDQRVIFQLSGDVGIDTETGEFINLKSKKPIQTVPPVYDASSLIPDYEGHKGKYLDSETINGQKYYNFDVNGDGVADYTLNPEGATEPLAGGIFSPIKEKEPNPREVSPPDNTHLVNGKYVPDDGYTFVNDNPNDFSTRELDPEEILVSGKQWEQLSGKEREILREFGDIYTKEEFDSYNSPATTAPKDAILPRSFSGTDGDYTFKDGKWQFQDTDGNWIAARPEVQDTLSGKYWNMVATTPENAILPGDVAGTDGDYTFKDGKWQFQDANGRWIEAKPDAQDKLTGKYWNMVIKQPIQDSSGSLTDSWSQPSYLNDQGFIMTPWDKPYYNDGSKDYDLTVTGNKIYANNVGFLGLFDKEVGTIGEDGTMSIYDEYKDSVTPGLSGSKLNIQATSSGTVRGGFLWLQTYDSYKIGGDTYVQTSDGTWYRKRFGIDEKVTNPLIESKLNEAKKKNEEAKKKTQQPSLNPTAPTPTSASAVGSSWYGRDIYKISESGVDSSGYQYTTQTDNEYFYKDRKWYERGTILNLFQDKEVKNTDPRFSHLESARTNPTATYSGQTLFGDTEVYISNGREYIKEDGTWNRRGVLKNTPLDPNNEEDRYTMQALDNAESERRHGTVAYDRNGNPILEGDEDKTSGPLYTSRGQDRKPLTWKDGIKDYWQNVKESGKPLDQAQTKQMLAEKWQKDQGYTLAMRMLNELLGDYAYDFISDYCKSEWDSSESASGDSPTTTEDIEMPNPQLSPSTSTMNPTDIQNLIDIPIITPTTAPVINCAYNLTSGTAQYTINGTRAPFRYNYTYTLKACKKSITFNVFMKPLNRSASIKHLSSGNLSLGATASKTDYFESDFVYNETCINTSDESFGTNGLACFVPPSLPRQIRFNDMCTPIEKFDYEAPVDIILAPNHYDSLEDFSADALYYFSQITSASPFAESYENDNLNLFMLNSLFRTTNLNDIKVYALQKCIYTPSLRRLIISLDNTVAECSQNGYIVEVNPLATLDTVKMSTKTVNEIIGNFCEYVRELTIMNPPTATILTQNQTTVPGNIEIQFRIDSPEYPATYELQWNYVTLITSTVTDNSVKKHILNLPKGNWIIQIKATSPRGIESYSNMISIKTDDTMTVNFAPISPLIIPLNGEVTVNLNSYINDPRNQPIAEWLHTPAFSTCVSFDPIGKITDQVTIRHIKGSRCQESVIFEAVGSDNRRASGTIIVRAG